MEIILFMLALAVVFAVKSVAILRWQDDEIAKSSSFSWTKPGTQEQSIIVEAQSSTSWAPSTTAAHLRHNRRVMPAA